MKYAVVIGALSVLLVGFGCQTAPEGPVQTAADGTMLRPTEVVEGTWFLTFDLPRGWVVVPDYDESTVTSVTTEAVTNQMTDVVLQSTDAVIDRDGDAPQAGAVTDKFLYAHIFRMDKRTGVPDEAEDMGNGFSRLMKGVTATYYYQGNLANYKFVVYWNNRELEEIEDVITSAKEVTNFQ
jgi:hypothetical protein